MYSSNIITNSDNDKKLSDMIQICSMNTTHSSKKSKKINKQKYKKISLDSIKNNPNIVNLKNRNITELHVVKYKPKRLLKITEQGIIPNPFYKMGSLSLDFDKTLNSDKTKFNNKNNINQNILITSTDNEKLVNSNNDNEFKSTYIFKFGKNSEDFHKLSVFSELFDENNDKRTFEDTFSKISKLIENQNNLYLNNLEYNSNSNNNNNNNLSAINNYELSPSKRKYSNTNINKSNNDMANIFTKTINNPNSYRQPNNADSTATNFSSSNYTVNMKKIIISWCDFIALINKLLSHIFKEFSVCKKENMKLKKKSYRDELKLNNKLNELDDIKKYVNRFDINLKINQQIQKEKEIKELKAGFKKKENEYMLSIYKLEDEIKMLTLLLEKNKNYYEEYKSVSKEIGKNKRQFELLKIKFNKELQDSNVKILIEKDFQDELKLKMQELKEEIKEIKLEKEMSKKENIELQAKIKKLEMIINEREENILMIYQELDYYMRKFNEEKFNHNNFKNEFNILEKKIYRLEEERQKEKAKKNNNDNDEDDVNSLSPKNYAKDENFGSPSPTNFTRNIKS